MKLDVNHYPSRAKTGRAAYCVDTRYVLEDGEQKYFATKQEAHAYIDRLEDELQLNTDGAWDWTFYDLLGFEKDKPVGGWVKHLQSEYDKGKISKSSWSEKHRHAKYFLTLKVNNKSTAQLKVRDLEMKHVQLQLLDQMAVGHTKKTVKNILTSLRAMNRYAILIGCRKTDPWQGAVAIGEIEGKATDGKVARVQPAVVKSIIGVMDPWWALMATFASSTGLRQGEQRALTWADLDLDGCKVDVNKAVKHRAESVLRSLPRATGRSRCPGAWRSSCASSTSSAAGRPRPSWSSRPGRAPSSATAGSRRTWTRLVPRPASKRSAGTICGTTTPASCCALSRMIGGRSPTSWATKASRQPSRPTVTGSRMMKKMPTCWTQ